MALTNRNDGAMRDKGCNWTSETMAFAKSMEMEVEVGAAVEQVKSARGPIDSKRVLFDPIETQQDGIMGNGFGDDQKGYKMR
jgi:hypothetical protein